MDGEGFAFFRWRTLNLFKYVLPECRYALSNWPVRAEWPAEKARRAAAKAQRGEVRTT